MKFFTAVLFVLFSFPVLNAQTPYHIQFKVEGLEGDSVVHVANYFGDKTYFFKKDVPLGADGSFEIKGDTMPTGGIYMILPQEQDTYFEFIWTEPSFSLELNMENPVSTMQVEGSTENQIFYDYLSFINERQRQVNALNQQLQNSSGEQKDALQKEIEQLSQQVIEYKESLFEKYPESFSVKIFKSSEDPQIPETIRDDQKASFYYFREHYFDHLDFQDERMLYTPVFHKKINYYLDQLTPRVPDSIAQAADEIIARAEGADLIYRYLVSTITYKYETSRMMGMDAVFVHMAETYYNSGKATWVPEENLKKIRDRAQKIKPLLLDKKAPRLVLQDTTGTWHDLYDLDLDYTLLIFYDPNCGHCKKELASLDSIHQDLRAKEVEVVAVNTELQNDDWKKFMKEKQYGFYLELSDTPEKPHPFRDIYDVTSTPQLFLLGKDKKIIAKKITAKQALQIVTDLEKRGQGGT